MKPKVEIKPLKVEDHRYIYQVWIDDEAQEKFIQWINSDVYPNTCVTASGPSARGVVAHCFSEEECQAHCNYLNQKILEGKII